MGWQALALGRWDADSYATVAVPRDPLFNQGLGMGMLVAPGWTGRPGRGGLGCSRRAATTTAAAGWRWVPRECLETGQTPGIPPVVALNWQKKKHSKQR